MNDATANGGTTKSSGRGAATRIGWLALAAVVVAYALYRITQPYEYALAGQLAPEVALATLDGAPLPFAEDLGSKVVVVNFWATWCPPCRQELPEFAKLATEFPGQNVAFYAVAIDQEPELIASVADSLSPRPPVAFDPGGAASNAYQVQYLPTTMVIDQSGVIQLARTGYSPVMLDEVRLEIGRLLTAN
ncbi:MAG: Thiol-disulfide oxidoreductase ResA [Candidatus Hydrogenedentota bacterium]